MSTAAATEAALMSASEGDLCTRLRRDPVSLLAPRRQLAAFRLIYRFPEFLLEQELPAAAAVFATWLFGDLNAKVLPYGQALNWRERRLKLNEGFASSPVYPGTEYRPYRVSWGALVESPTLNRAVEATTEAELERLTKNQVARYFGGTKRVENERAVAAIDRWSQLVWARLRKHAANVRSQEAWPTGWLPLPSTGVNTTFDLASSLRPTQAAIIFGGARLYPLLRGHCQRSGQTTQLTLTEVRFDLLDDFNFDDDGSQRYAAINRAIRQRPNVLGYPNGREDSQSLGPWTPDGRLALTDTTEPAIELLNQSFNEFAAEVAATQARIRAQRGCTNVSALVCRLFPTFSSRPEQTLKTAIVLALPAEPVKQD